MIDSKPAVDQGIGLEPLQLLIHFNKEEKLCVIANITYKILRTMWLHMEH